MHARRLTFVALATLGLAALPAHADTTYTNQADFNAALGGGPSSTFLFTGGGGTALASRTFSQNGYSFTVTAPGPSSQLVYQNNIVGTNTPEDDLLVTFNSGTVTALGGNFFGTTINDTFANAIVHLTLSNGSTFNFLPGSRNVFRGIVTDSPIVSLRFLAPTSLIDQPRYATIDNLVVGTVRTTAAVPEPASSAVLIFGLMGLAGLALTARKRVAQAA